MDLDNTEAQCNKLEKVWIRVEKEDDVNRCSSKHGGSFVLNKEIINSTSRALYSSYRLHYQERHDICPESKQRGPTVASILPILSCSEVPNEVGSRPKPSRHSLVDVIRRTRRRAGRPPLELSYT